MWIGKGNALLGEQNEGGECPRTWKGELLEEFIGKEVGKMVGGLECQ